MYFSIKYRYSDILLKRHKLYLSRLFCCKYTCYCVNMVSVTSVSRIITSASCYHPRYQRRPSMNIRGLIPRNFAELAEACLIDCKCYTFNSLHAGKLCMLCCHLLIVFKKKKSFRKPSKCQTIPVNSLSNNWTTET